MPGGTVLPAGVPGWLAAGPEWRRGGTGGGSPTPSRHMLTKM